MDININERYHIIEGFENYIVTENGKIYSIKNKTQSLYEISLRGKNNPKRYLQVCLYKNNKCKYMQVHRLVAYYFCAGYFDGAVVNHKDNDIHNNHYTNLEWITQKENIHLGYIHSKVNQVRNFRKLILIYPDGTESQIFIGFNKLKEFIENNNIDVSVSSLSKHHRSRGFILKELNNKNSND